MCDYLFRGTIAVALLVSGCTSSKENILASARNDKTAASVIAAAPARQPERRKRTANSLSVPVARSLHGTASKSHAVADSQKTNAYLSAQLAKQKDHPLPTEYVFKSKADKDRFRQGRKEWIEMMHRSAPGTDWREMDRAARARRMTKSTALRAASSLPQPIPQTSIAPGISGAVWRERGSDNLAGRMLTTEYDPSDGAVFALSAAGIVWRGNVTGSSWTPLNDSVRFGGAIDLLLFNRSGGGRRLMVVCNDPKGAYYSDDDGATWQVAAGLDTEWGDFRSACVAREVVPKLYVAKQIWDWELSPPERTAIFKSTDGGGSFTRIGLLDAGSSASLFSPRTGSTRVMIAHKGTCYEINTSNDSIVSMGSMPGASAESAERIILSGKAISGGQLLLYAAYSANNSTTIYRSSNSGASWLRRGTTDGLFGAHSFACSLKDDDRVFSGAVNCFRSWNGGSSWTRVNEWYEYYGREKDRLHADIPGIDVFLDTNGQEIIFVSTDGGTYTSRDSLATVSNISLKGLRVSQYYTVYTHKTQPQIVYAGSQDQGFQRTTVGSGGIFNFDQLISGDYGHLASGNGGQSVWAVYPGFAIFYANATSSKVNRTWDFGNNGMTGQLWMPPVMEDPINSSAVFLGGGSTQTGRHSIWRLTDNGVSISATQSAFNFGSQVSALAYATLNTSVFYAANRNGEFFYSFDRGTNWTKSSSFQGPSSHYFYGSSIVSSPANLGEVFFAGSGYSSSAVYRSTDHGASFQTWANGLPSTMVYQIDVSSDGKYLFAATELGPYVCLLPANDWRYLGNSAPDQTYWSVEYVPTRKVARFGTYGRGIWDVELIEDADSDSLPDRWEISRFGSAGANPQQDSDGDGRSNLAEFFFATDPLAASDRGATQTAVETIAGQQYMNLSFRRNRLATGVPFNLEVSDDLRLWRPAIDELQQVGPALSIDDDTEQLTYRMTRPLGQATKLFFRVAVGSSILSLDSANDTVYNGGWTSGRNGGYGFGSWSLASTSTNGGHYIATSSGSSRLPSSFGRGFGLWANSGAVASAQRPLSRNSAEGDVLTITMDNNWVDTGRTVGFALTDSAGATRLSFFFRGGETSYRIQDSLMNRDTGIPYTDQGLTIQIQLKGGNSYRLNSGTNVITGQLGPGSPISSLVISNNSAGSGSGFDFFVGEMSVHRSAFSR